LMGCGTNRRQHRCNIEKYLPIWVAHPNLILVGALRTKKSPTKKGYHMIRSELIKKLEAENPELKTEEIEKIVDLFFGEIIQRLADGGRVELRGFGAFSTRDRSPRRGRNPRTGASVEVPSKRVPYFKPGKEIRERLNK